MPQPKILPTQREPWRDKIPAWLYYIVGLLDFDSNDKCIIKSSSLWPSADVKPMSIDLVLYIYIYIYIYISFFLWFLGYALQRTHNGVY